MKYDFMKPLMEESDCTPAYVFHLDELEKHVKKVETILNGKASLCYAMKANPFLVGRMSEIVPQFEVCSPGEFLICERMGIPMERIVLSGVYKNPEDIEYVFEKYQGKGIYTVESRTQWELLCGKAAEKNLAIEVLLRLTSGNQFGMDEKEICRIVSESDKYPMVKILGVQFYSSTQKKKTDQMREELQQLDLLVKNLKEEYGLESEVVEYGPGLYVPYFQKDPEQELEEQVGAFRELLENMEFGGKIVLEMGRFLAAWCGYFVTSVVDVKENQEVHYALVDGGIHHINYFGQTMAMKFPHISQLDEEGKEKEGEEIPHQICGSLCTVNDVIVKQYPLKDVKVRDMLVFERVGAYSVMEGISLFLSRPLPSVYLYSEKNGLKKVRGHYHTDLLNSEK